jgi:hypothetical protein
MNRPVASLSLDVDNLWTYLKIHGDAGWETFPSYLDTFIPNVLRILDRLNLKITFFIVGQDAALSKNREALELLSERGHEIGSHSFHHEPWLKQYTRDELRREISEADVQLYRVTGEKPVGFRAPGFSWSPELLEVLAENDYTYDASTFPTYIGPLARAYYFSQANLTTEQRNQRSSLFGDLREGNRPVKPYCWRLAAGKTLLEIPVTTIPIIKTPFHLSYLIYLSRYSTLGVVSYLKTAVTMCRMTGTEPSFLLHPLDFLDRRQAPELSFFPGMDMCVERKIEVFERVVQVLSKHFTFVSMGDHARSIIKRNGLVVYAPYKQRDNVSYALEPGCRNH